MRIQKRLAYRIEGLVEMRAAADKVADAIEAFQKAAAALEDALNELEGCELKIEKIQG